jgi:hypothetical protein
MTKLTAPERNTLPSHVIARPKDAVSQSIRKSIGAAVYEPRARDPNEATPPEQNIWERPVYVPGDGDHTAQVPRAGSQNARNLRSLGFGT